MPSKITKQFGGLSWKCFILNIAWNLKTPANLAQKKESWIFILKKPPEIGINLNNCLETSVFPDELKIADIATIFEKVD